MTITNGKKAITILCITHLQRETETINAQNETEDFKSSRFINMWNVYAKKSEIGN